MQKEENQQTELDLSKELIRDQLDLLTRYGFDYTKSQVEHSDLVGNSTDFTFFDKKSSITLDINFSPARGRKPRVFVVIIKNNQGHWFDVERYLKYHNKNDLIPFFTDRGRDIDIRAFWARFFEVLASLLSNDLREIISGARWEEIPFDWDGYK